MSFRDLGNTCVVGLQWGDEGKGKVVDLLLADFDVVVRYSGGANAGHTVVIERQKFALHQLPSGILREEVLSIISCGVVLDPAVLLGEVASLRARGVKIGDNLRISDRAHLVFPYHRREDVLAEGAARIGEKLGTTSRGIGPCYADKHARHWAIRICDFAPAERFRQRLAEVVAAQERLPGRRLWRSRDVRRRAAGGRVPGVRRGAAAVRLQHDRPAAQAAEGGPAGCCLKAPRAACSTLTTAHIRT